MAPRCYVLGVSNCGCILGQLHRRLWTVPERVGYDEVYDRVLFAGVQVREPERLAVGSVSHRIPAWNGVAWTDQDAGGGEAAALSVNTYRAIGLQIGETRRVCFGADRVLDIVRTH